MRYIKIYILYTFNNKVPQKICMHKLCRSVVDSGHQQIKMDQSRISQVAKTYSRAPAVQDHGKIPLTLQRSHSMGARLDFCWMLYFLHGSLAKNNFMPVVFYASYQLVLDHSDSWNRDLYAFGFMLSFNDHWEAYLSYLVINIRRSDLTVDIFLLKQNKSGNMDF